MPRSPWTDWDEPLALKRVSWFFPPLREEAVRHVLTKPRLERAIGVIYRPDTERQSHYFYASMPSQFDAVLHFAHTSAVRPLERTAQWTLPEVRETFPTGV